MVARGQTTRSILATEKDFWMSTTLRETAQQYPQIQITRGFGIVLALCLLSATNIGCVTFAANLVRAIKGDDTPAEFNELKDKKVAVLVNTSAGLNQDASGIIMANYVHVLLSSNVHKIKMVNQDEVARIIQDQPADGLEMSTIGKRLNADYIISISISNLKLKDGQTLYKGSCTTNVSVFNVSEGNGAVFRKSIPDFVFPQTGVPITDTDEATFQRFYLSEVAHRVARIFYPYDPSVDVAKDASMASIQSLQR